MRSPVLRPHASAGLPVIGKHGFGTRMKPQTLAVNNTPKATDNLSVNCVDV